MEAIIDHNAHLERHHAQNKDGKGSFISRMKKWDTTPTMENYEYIPLLMDDITILSESSCRLEDKKVLDENHPKQQQPIITNTEPIQTNEIVATKQSRFN